MSTIIGNYLVEYVVGHQFCCVYKIGRVDEFDRLMDMKLVFRSSDWEECKQYALDH